MSQAGRVLAGVVFLVASAAMAKGPKILLHPLEEAQVSGSALAMDRAELESAAERAGVDGIPAAQITPLLLALPGHGCQGKPDCLARLAQKAGADATLYVAVNTWAPEVKVFWTLVSASGGHVDSGHFDSKKRGSDRRKWVAAALKQLFGFDLNSSLASLTPAAGTQGPATQGTGSTAQASAAQSGTASQGVAQNGGNGSSSTAQGTQRVAQNGAAQTSAAAPDAVKPPEHGAPAQASLQPKDDGTQSNVSPAVAPQASGRWMRPTAIAVGVAGAAGLVAGYVIGHGAVSDWQNAVNNPSSPASSTQQAQLLDQRSSYSSRASLGNALTLGGGVALAAGAALFTYDLMRPRAGMDVAIAASPRAVWVEGRF